MYLYTIFFLCFIQTVFSVNLSKTSQERIKSIIQHPGTTFEMREQINTILFNSYKDWATTKAMDYKYLHKNKCSHIKKDELISYALFGLYEGIKRYNGNNTFITYIEFYIKNELQQCTMKLFPINALPKTYIRRKKTSHEYYKMNYIYLKPIYIGFDNYLMEKTRHNSLYSHENKWFDAEDEIKLKIKIWEKIRQLPSFQMKIMYCKYSGHFDILHSNKEVAEIMDYSTKKIRVNLSDAKNKLLPFINNNLTEDNNYNNNNIDIIPNLEQGMGVDCVQ